MRPKPKLRIIAGALATVILIAISGQVLWNSFERSKQASQWVEHTYQVLISSERFLSNVRAAESSSQAYVMTRKKGYLQGFARDVEQQARTLAQLRRLTADNMEQQGRLGDIESLAAHRIGILDAAAKAVDEQHSDVMAGMAQGGEGGRVMGELTAKGKRI